MSKILKVLLFIVGILIFFEIGLFASYNVISSNFANPSEIISSQIDSVFNFIGSLTGEKKLDDQDTLNVTNNDDVALILNNITGLSVNLNSVTAKVSVYDTGNQTVTITAIATKYAQITSEGAIEIIPEQTYSITATAIGNVYSNGKVKINTTSILLKEKIVLYNQNNNASGNVSIDNLVKYTQNNTTINNTAQLVNINSNRARA